MQAMWDNLGQVAVIAAFVTLAGVVLKALLDWFTSSRSKYVDVIAAERIKWVRELRSDFLDLCMSLDSVSHEWRHQKVDVTAANKSADEVNRQLNLIHLKLNPESALDKTIYSLMARSAYLARTGDIRGYADLRTVLIRYSLFLLKDEWEKAKREASGPVRWLWLSWKHKRRLRARDRFANEPSVKALLGTAAVPLSTEEKLKLLGELSESQHNNLG